MRLLIVEDEAGMARALRRGLEAEGFVVEHAPDGPRGLALARFGGFDAVLLDVMLPGMSGYTVVKTLRAEQNWVPVLMISAKDGEYDQADGLDYGADDYLVKPFSFVVLLARLRALLRREPAPRPAVLTCGALALDPATHEVTLDGAVVSLAPREFGVLEALLRAAPAVKPPDAPNAPATATTQAGRDLAHLQAEIERNDALLGREPAPPGVVDPLMKQAEDRAKGFEAAAACLVGKPA